MTKMRIRTGLATAAAVLGLGLIGGGAHALASPAAAPPDPPNSANSQQQLTQMDARMTQMVATLPADQRAAAQQMHEQMRPQMAQMLSGPNGMGAMMSGQHGTDAMMDGQHGTGASTGG